MDQRINGVIFSEKLNNVVMEWCMELWGDGIMVWWSKEYVLE